MHGQRGLLAVEKNLQVRAFSLLKGGALLGKPLFHLLGVHENININVVFNDLASTYAFVNAGVNLFLGSFKSD